jgi:hypothetical protein
MEFTGRHITVTENDIQVGLTDLCLLYQSRSYDVSVGNVTCNSQDIVPGGTLQLEFPITNLGTEAVESVCIEVLDNTDTVINSIFFHQTLFPGETMDAYAVYDLSVDIADLAAHNVKIRVTIPEHADRDMANNTQDVLIDRASVQIDEVNIYKFGDVFQVSANISNYGYSPVSNCVLTMGKFNNSGEVLFTECIDNIAARDLKTVAYTVTAEGIGLTELVSEALIYVSLDGEDGNIDHDTVLV